MKGILVLIVIVSTTFIIIGLISSGNSAKKEERRRNERAIEDDCYKAYCKGMAAKSVNGCRKQIDALNTALVQLHDLSPDNDTSLIRQDLEELREWMHDLEEDAWQEKAEKHLQAFSDCYEMIMNGDLDNFRDVEELFRIKKKCLDEWHKYFAIDLDAYKTTIYPKRFMREYMGDLFDSCMDSSESLEKKLSEKVQTMRPEYARKMRLLEQIVNYVIDNPNIQRSCLLKTSFDGFTPKEIEICYKALIQKRRLIEMKIGNWYYVDLTDNERGRNKHKKQDAETKKEEEQMIDSKTEVLCRAVIQHLIDSGVEFVDKTQQGGAIYFFDENIANELKEKGYNPKFAENGTKNTGHRPAWYVSIK